MIKPGTPTGLTYCARLDGLRALAVLSVFAEHLTFNEFVRGLSPGMVGVRVFFVLSGFLITSILLQERGTDTHGALARRFFSRRFWRLAPALYVAIILAMVLGLANMTSEWWIHVIYLSNFQIYRVQEWTGAGHFWTLALEQQFYLLWFPLVIIAPRRYLVPVIVVCLVSAPAFRMMIANGGDVFLDVLMPAQIDSLAAGALIAVAMRSAALAWLDRLLLDRRLLIALLGFGLVLLAPWPEIMGQRPASFRWVYAPIFVTLASACLIRQCLAARDGTLGWLSHPVLVHIGKISYGLYLFHYFVPYVWFIYVPPEYALAGSGWRLLRAAIWVFTSFAMAELSWRLVERPLMSRRAGEARKQPDAARAKRP